MATPRADRTDPTGPAGSRPPRRRLLAYAWAAPNSALGLVIGLLMLATGARLQSCAGIAEFTGGHLGQRFGRLGRCGFSAMTLGHVVLATSQADLAVLRAHEQVHVGQYERWGPLFLPAYVVDGLWQLARGRCPYRDNRFERQARRQA